MDRFRFFGFFIFDCDNWHESVCANPLQSLIEAHIQMQRFIVALRDERKTMNPLAKARYIGDGAKPRGDGILVQFDGLTIRLHGDHEIILKPEALADFERFVRDVRADGRPAGWRRVGRGVRQPVLVQFDGFTIRLRTGDYEISLKPDALAEFEKFVRDVRADLKRWLPEGNEP